MRESMYKSYENTRLYTEETWRSMDIGTGIRS